MNRLLNLVMRQLLRVGMQTMNGNGTPLTPEQREAQKRVNKAIKASRRINRI